MEGRSVSEGSASLDERPAQGGRSRDLLWWLRSHDALVRRLVLSQVVGTPRSRRPAFLELGSIGARGRLRALYRGGPGAPPGEGR
jgi:hypothetical protein